MLILFVLCTFLRTLQGASVPSPPDALGSVAPEHMSAFMGREPPVSDNNTGQQLRTAYSIAQSCLLTIFACVWTSGHPNINGPRDSGWTRLKRRLVTMLWTVIAPEFVFFLAVSQYGGAKWIAKQYNEEFFPRSEKTEASLWEEAVSWFRPLPKPATRRGDKQPWTITHGFFLQMGGFMLYDDEYPTETLSFNRLVQLLRDQAIDAPAVTERDLQDHSKGDTISKGIVILQTIWFAIQCIARAPQHLPLSELEVLTLAFVVINGAIYVLWWHKPQGVEMAICIPLKNGKPKANSPRELSTNEEPYEPENVASSEHTSLPQSDQHSNNKQTIIPLPDSENHLDEYAEETHTWFWRQVQKDYQKYSIPHFLVIRLPYRFFLSVLRPAAKMGDFINQERKTNLRMPMFYAISSEEDKDSDGKDLFLGCLCIITGPLFGAVHFIAWGSDFPSPLDRIVWRISAILMTVGPLPLILGVALADQSVNTIEMGMDAIGTGFIVLSFFLIPFYIAARFACVIIAFKAIVRPTAGVLLDISWTSYIPHL